MHAFTRHLHTRAQQPRSSLLRCRYITPLLLLTCGLFLLVALVPQQSHALGILTVLGLIFGAKMAKSGLDATVDNATSDVKGVVDHTKAQIDDLIQQLESTYDGALNTTLDSLDSFTGQQLTKLAGLFDQINNTVMGDWQVVQSDMVQLLQQVDGTIQQTLSRMEDLIVVGVRGATFVIDKTTYNIAFLLAVVLTAVGLLMFVRLLWTARRPDNGGVRIGAIALMAVYMVFCSALLAPQARAYAITMVGQGKQLEDLGSGPHLFSLTPNRLITGEPGELTLVGANFDTGGPPQVMVGAKAVTPDSWSSDHVIVKISGATSKLSGPQAVTVRTASGELSNGIVATFQAPSTPTKILSWRLWPTGQKADLTKDTDSRTLNVVCKLGHGWASNSLEVKLDGDWIIDRDRPAAVSVLLGAPGADRGYTEAVVNVYPQTYRTVEYLANDRGIKVTAKCLQFGFKAKYVVHGRKYVLRDGDAINGGALDVTDGIKTIDKYPARKLKTFRNKQPNQYNFKVQVRLSTGDVVERSAVFTPGSPIPLKVDGIEIWMENESLKANRPGGSLSAPSVLPINKSVLRGMQNALKSEISSIERNRLKK